MTQKYKRNFPISDNLQKFTTSLMELMEYQLDTVMLECLQTQHQACRILQFLRITLLVRTPYYVTAKEHHGQFQTTWRHLLHIGV